MRTAPETIIDRNREIVRKIYEIADRGAGTEHEQYMAEHGQFMSAHYSLTQAPGHPVPGHWTGPHADAAIARVFNVCGNTGITVREIVADGPHRVIGLVDAHGTAQDGTPWTMPVAECFWIEDGKVTDIRPFYWDLVELRRIAGLA
jgi:ketosteroid isomerase-like protein